jgi:hypothetical protein
MRRLVFLLLPLILLAACNGGETTTAQLPEGFPADFPIYEGATITAAGRINPGQGDIYAIGMETTDAADAVRSFYEDRLAVAPWEISNVLEIPEENTVIVEFVRQEGDDRGGTVSIQEEETDGQKTTIAISLPAPPSTATPAASPGP